MGRTLKSIAVFPGFYLPWARAGGSLLFMDSGKPKGDWVGAGSQTASIALTTSDELAPVVQSILQRLFARIRVLVPDADLHHIGATAVPGALTKGDIDILLRVLPSEFPAVVDALKRHFQAKQPANWTPEFASFGDDSAYTLPVGIQVVVNGSSLDFFLFLRDYFIQNPAALAEYNRVKTASWKEGQEEYWKAKDELLSRILAGRKT